MNIQQPAPLPTIGTTPPTPQSLLGVGSRFIWIEAVLLVGLFYLLDVWIAAHIALPICYAAAMVLAVALPRKREKVAVAGACTVILLADAYYMHRTSAMAGLASLENQGFALLMIWSVTTLGLRHHSVEAGRRDSERIANERLALLNTIYTSAPVGLCFVDLNLRYLSMNSALAEMHDRAPEYFIGKTIRDANPDLADTIEVYYRRVIESGKPVLDVEIKGTTAARPGERYSWLATYLPVHNPSGELLGVNVAVRDITGRKQAEADTLFLLDLADCIRFAANADELTWVVAVALGEHVKANRCTFVRDRYGPGSVHHSTRLSPACPVVSRHLSAGRVWTVVDRGRPRRSNHDDRGCRPGCAHERAYRVLPASRCRCLGRGAAAARRDAGIRIGDGATPSRASGANGKSYSSIWSLNALG